MTRLLLSAVVVTAVSCATTGGASHRVAKPILHKDDAPIAFMALGAKYAVPARLGVTDHEREPGIAWFDFTDQNTGCSGSVMFAASSDRTKPTGYVVKAMEEDVAHYTAGGIESKVLPTTQPMLGEKAQVQVAQLHTATDSAAKAHFGLFVPEQQLVVMGNVFCSDPGFMDPELHLVAQLVDSQKQ